MDFRENREKDNVLLLKRVAVRLNLSLRWTWIYYCCVFQRKIPKSHNVKFPTTLLIQRKNLSIALLWRKIVASNNSLQFESTNIWVLLSFSVRDKSRINANTPAKLATQWRRFSCTRIFCTRNSLTSFAECWKTKRSRSEIGSEIGQRTQIRFSLLPTFCMMNMDDWNVRSKSSTMSKRQWIIQKYVSFHTDTVVAETRKTHFLMSENSILQNTVCSAGILFAEIISIQDSSHRWG